MSVNPRSPFDTEISLAATVERLERAEGPVLGGAEFPGELNAGGPPMFLVFRVQVVSAVRRGRTFADDRRHRDRRRQ